MENRKAILLDPFNILKPKEIVDRLNNYKKKTIQKYKDEATSEETIDVVAKEKEIEQYIEKVFSPAGEDVCLFIYNLI